MRLVKNSTILVTNDKNLINKALISKIRSSMFDDFYLELNGLQAKNVSPDGGKDKVAKAVAGSSKDLVVKTRSVEMIQDVEFHIATEDTLAVTNVSLIKKNKKHISKIVSLYFF